MPDDERTRRRLGDDTKARIADLASGWDTPVPDDPPAPAGTPAPTRPVTPPPPRTRPPDPRDASASGEIVMRPKSRTTPPPAPGSAARKAMEESGQPVRKPNDAPASTPSPAPRVVATTPERDDRTEHVSDMAVRVARTATEQLRVVDPRAETAEASTGPRYPRAGYQGAPSPLATERRVTTPQPKQHTPPIIVDDPQLRREEPSDLARIPTATGEVLLEDDEDNDDTQRKPDVVAPSEPPRGDMTSLESQTEKFGLADRPDVTEHTPPSGMRHPTTGATLRRTAALRRKRGVLGDVRYVFTALAGMRRAKTELTALDRQQELRTAERRKYLVTLGRAAVVTEAFDHPELGKAREALQRIEEERGRHAGAVAASDAELERVRRDREAKAKAYAEATARTDAELADLAKKLEPLEKEAAGVRKRAAELRDSLARVEKKIADTEGLRTSVKAEKMDKAAIEADIATYRADRLAILRDEPTIAAALDALNPRIAAMEASRAELTKKRQELDKAEKDDQGRTLELLDAIGAKRKVVERAAVEAEQARDKALYELGERLYVERPTQLTNLLSPIDQIDLELGEGERSAMELREILSNIDKAKFSRGAAVIILVGALAGCFVWWLVHALT